MSEHEDLIASARGEATFRDNMEPTIARLLYKLADALAHAATRERHDYEAGFDAGFGVSGEGWNAEHPFGNSLLPAERIASERKRLHEQRAAAYARYQQQAREKGESL